MANPPELLFDTTALIDVYRGMNRIRPYFDSILTGEIIPYVSVVTEAELWRGMRAEELARHEMIMEQFTSLPLDSDASHLAGAWMKKFVDSGLGWMDAFIAATGKMAGLPVLTRDKRLAELLSTETKFELYPST
ncbi:MAG: PIN domain-containing protein [Chloroflexota bacterium]